MREVRRLLVLGLLCSPLTVLSLWAQGVTVPARLVAGMAQWQDQGVPAEYSYLLRTLPAQLLDSAAGCETHQLSGAEQEALGQKLRERQRDILEKEVSRLRRTLDDMLFDPGKTSADRAGARAAWEEKRTAWLNFTEDSALEATIPRDMPLVLSSGEGENPLLPVFSGPAATYPEPVDFLIHGSIEQVEGLLYFTLGIYSFLEDKELVSLKKAYLPEEGKDFLEEARLLVIDTLLGRSWASLTLKAGEEAASLFLNGEPVGSGGVHLAYLVPGRYEVQAKAPGYEVETVEVELRHRQRVTLEMVLTPLDWTTLKITTGPAGADLYMGSRWLGVSPWEGEFPPGQSILSVRKQGYLDTSRYVPEKRKSPMGIGLSVQGLAVDHLMETQKKRFYSSLGTFVLTLPIPFILQGISQYSAQAWYNENNLYGSSAETDRLRQISLLSYYGSQGALFIQGALFVNMVIDAVRYVKTTDLLFTR